MRFSGGEMVFHRLEIRSKATNVAEIEGKSINTPEVVSRGAFRFGDICGHPQYFIIVFQLGFLNRFFYLFFQGSIFFLVNLRYFCNFLRNICVLFLSYINFIKRSFIHGMKGLLTSLVTKGAHSYRYFMKYSVNIST